MMKHIYSILSLLLLFHFPLFGQDTIRSAPHKNQFYVQTGIYYKNFLGNRYIEPQLNNSSYTEPFEKHQYERFTKIPTFGFNAGILFTHIFNKHWGITTGMTYFFKKDIFENNQDTVIKYGNGSSMRDIHNTLKYEYTYHSIEIPIMVQYSVKKFTFYTGCYFSLLAYKKSAYTYVINQLPQTPQWTTSDKTFAGFELPLKLFPTVQVSYEIAIKNIKVKPFLAFYYAIKNQNDFYTQFGMNFLLNKNQKSKTNSQTLKIKKQ